MFRRTLLPRYRLVLCATLLLFCHLSGGIENDSAQRLRHALPGLRSAPSDVRRVFVEVAVAVLSDRFLAAAGESNNDAGWARGTRAYVALLWRAVDAARAGGEVSLIEEHDGGLRVVVAGREAQQFALLPPRPEERASVEAEVMEHLCRSVDCRYFEPLPDRPIESDRRPAIGTAHHDATRPRDGSDGLTCLAGGGRHQRLREQACVSLMREIRGLAKTLRKSANSGQRLEWEVLHTPLWRERGRQLIVAADGASVTVEAPLLARYPGIMQSIMPWVRARLGGTVREQIVEPPARLVYTATQSKISNERK